MYNKFYTKFQVVVLGKIKHEISFLHTSILLGWCFCPSSFQIVIMMFDLHRLTEEMLRGVAAERCWEQVIILILIVTYRDWACRCLEYFLNYLSSHTYVQLGLKALTLVRVFSFSVGIQDDLQWLIYKLSSLRGDPWLWQTC